MTLTIEEENAKKYEVSNEEIVEKYINRYKHSKRSWETRKYNLKYFFETRYFGYSGHVFDLRKRDVIDYFDFLNYKEDICLQTKINKWNTFRSFLQFVMEYYDELVIVIPKFSINWKAIHKVPKSNKHVVLTIEEIKKILNYCKNYRYIYYIIYRACSLIPSYVGCKRLLVKIKSNSSNDNFLISGEWGFCP